MGVNKLWSILQEASRLVKLETLSGKILAVDASIWMYHFFKAFRDKEGNYINNGHIIGFFRRICKLLFFGIKPIFVFDGNVPFLKQRIMKKRAEKRLKYDENSEKIAEKIFLLQIKEIIEKEIQKKQENILMNTSKKSPYFRNMEVLSKNIKILQDKAKDIYDLPKLKLPFEKMRRSDDFRIINEENIPESMQNFNSDDLNFLDFSKIDFNSDFFKSLSLTDQYNILSLARSKSRLRIGLSAYELMTMFPDSMEFSKFQINRVKERNDLTQRLLNFNGTNKTGVLRVAGEPNKEYLLVKNENVKPGWTLSFDSEIKNDVVINDENKDVDYENQEFEDIPLDNINLGKKSKFLNINLEELLRKSESDILTDSAYNMKNSPLFLLSDDSDDFNDFDINEDQKYSLIRENKDSLRIENTDSKKNLELNYYSLKPCVNTKKNKIKSQKLKSNNKLFLPQLCDIFSEKSVEVSTNTSNFEKKNHSISSRDGILESNNHKILFDLKNPEYISDLSKKKIDFGQIANLALPNNIFSFKTNNKELLKTREFFDELFSSNEQENRTYFNNKIDEKDTGSFDINKVNIESIKNAFFKDKIPINRTVLETTDNPASYFPVVNKFDETGFVMTKFSDSFKKSQEAFEISNVSINSVLDINDYENYDLNIENDLLSKHVFKENKKHNSFFSQLNNIDNYSKNHFKELETLMGQYRKNKKNADNVTQIMVEECRILLKLFGIPYIIAPAEAEAQCAELVRLGLADGIITDDSDVFLFGGTNVYRNMFNHSKYVELYLLSDLEQEFNLDRKNLIRLAHLLGSDYAEGIQKIGPVTALEILSEFPDSNNLNEFKEWCNRVKNFQETDNDKESIFKCKFKKNVDNIILPKDFPNPLVDKAYLEPNVDSCSQQFKWEIPDLDNLTNFLKSTIGWSSQKINEIVIPVIRNMNFGHIDKIQITLKDYWSTNSINTFVSQRKITKITRFTKALNNLKKSKKTLFNEVRNPELIHNENVMNNPKDFSDSCNDTESSVDEINIAINTQKYKRSKILDSTLNLNKRKYIFKNTKKKKKYIN
ncbi:hypothetical protein PMAC_000898 [Pneumocystis sp. 'macacae']|nr:hypothetical protein PMAC_000898 [Pneumocystis sp. 'macacae']